MRELVSAESEVIIHSALHSQYATTLEIVDKNQIAIDEDV